jgi:hypothetical protein
MMCCSIRTSALLNSDPCTKYIKRNNTTKIGGAIIGLHELAVVIYLPVSAIDVDAMGHSEYGRNLQVDSL